MTATSHQPIPTARACCASAPRVPSRLAAGDVAACAPRTHRTDTTTPSARRRRCVIVFPYVCVRLLVEAVDHAWMLRGIAPMEWSRCVRHRLPGTCAGMRWDTLFADLEAQL